MKTKIKKGDLVRDRWFKEWGIGKCTKALKTVFWFEFDGLNETIKFDKDHIKFLDRV